MEKYVLRSGIFSIGLPNIVITGVGFTYEFDENLGRWRAITKATGESAILTLAEVEVDTWYFMESEVNADGTSVEFFINHVSVGTLMVAANIPSGPGINHFYSTHIMKLLGTTARYLSIDAYSLYQELNR